MTVAGQTPRLRLKTLRALPSGIWALGFVSLFMDVSSELIHGLLPVYLVSGLGASMLTVGFIEGASEATTSVAKLFSGVASDWLRRRKLLAVLGYSLAALSKPIFPLAPSVSWIFAARLIDRVGKGIRGAPRDALVADLSPPDLRGASFGLRQALDTAGAFIGPVSAIGLMWMFAGNFRTVFWFSVFPAAIAVALLVWGVREPQHAATPKAFPLRLSELRRLSGAYWLVIAITAAFTLARFSEAFLILRAQGAGVPIVLAPLVLVVMNLVYALAAYPAGALSDRGGRIRVLMIGIVLLIGADAALGFAPGGLVGVFGGVALWGLHLGFTQGVLSTLVADTAPADLRGTAFGVFNLVSGLVLLAASVIAGELWTAAGAEWTFAAGAAFAGIALAALLLAKRRIVSL